MSGDPRLSTLIKNGQQGNIIIIGSPFDFFRNRTIHKGGEDHGPCCLRRFYPKVGPLINPEFQINISNLSVSDFGNFYIEVSEEEEQEKFINVKSKKFKGQFVNYLKQSPEKIIQSFSQTILNFLSQSKLPFIFGGSKECVLASANAFFEKQTNPDAVFMLMSASPSLKKPFDGNKGTADNILTILSQQHPTRKFSHFGSQIQFFPSEFINLSENEKTVKNQTIPNVEFILLNEIRKWKLKKEKVNEFTMTQGCHKLMDIFPQNIPIFVSISVDVMCFFMGCRDIHCLGLEIEEMMEIMMFLGTMKNVVGVCINQFNPSCQDFESSLKILNMFYYFLMGRAKNDCV